MQTNQTLAKHADLIACRALCRLTRLIASHGKSAADVRKVQQPLNPHVVVVLERLAHWRGEAHGRRRVHHNAAPCQTLPVCCTEAAPRLQDVALHHLYLCVCRPISALTWLVASLKVLKVCKVPPLAGKEQLQSVTCNDRNHHASQQPSVLLSISILAMQQATRLLPVSAPAQHKRQPAADTLGYV